MATLSLSGKSSNYGVTAGDNRLFLNAVVCILRSGAPWACLPERFGLPNTVCKPFRRLVWQGLWERLFPALHVPDLDWVILDSTILRAY